MVFHGVMSKLRRPAKGGKDTPPTIETKKTNDTSLGDTIPTKHQFYLETPVKEPKIPEASMEKLLLSFGHSPGEGIRTSSSVSSLSSNSASTYDLPRRKSIEASEDNDNDSSNTTRGIHPLGMFCYSPTYFEQPAPPLDNAKHVPSTFWSTLFECCHPVLETEPTLYSTAPTDKTLLGRFLDEDAEDEQEDVETNQVVQKHKRGIFRGWNNNKSNKNNRGCGTESAFFLNTSDEQ